MPLNDTTDIVSIYYQFVIFKCESKSTLDKVHLNHAIQYLQDYNQVNVKDVGVLSSSQFYVEDNSFLQDIHDRYSQIEENVRFFTFFHASGNLSKAFDKIKQFSAPSIIMLPDFKSSKEIRDAFFELPRNLTTSKIWLFLFSSNFDSQEDMSRHIVTLLSHHSNYVSKLSLDSQVYAIVNIKNVLQLVELYQACSNREISIRPLTPLLLEDKPLPKYIWEQRKDLGQCRIRVGYMFYGKDVENSTTIADLKGNRVKQVQPKRMVIDTGGLTLEGFSAQRFALLQSALNFSIEWIYVDDLSFGAFENETWNGIIGLLLNSTIDTSIHELSMTAERNEAISYATPSQSYKAHLFSLKPGPTLSWHTFRDVFDTIYWAMLIIFVILFTIFLLLRSKKSEAPKITGFEEMSHCIGHFSQSLRAFVALDVTNLTDPLSTRIHSKRILILVICFCGAVNFYVYNAGLISYLMVQENHLLINDLSDMLRYPQYKLWVFAGSSDESFLKSSEFNEILNESKEEGRMFSNYETSEKRLLEGKNMVVFGESPTFEVLAKSYPCQVVRSKSGYNYNFAAFPFPKESPYIPLFTYAVNKMIENGLMTERLDRIKENMECDDPTSKYFRTVSYKEVISAFAIFLAGCFLAFGCCMIEWIYNIFTYKRRRQWKKNDLQIHYRKFQMLRQEVQLLIMEIENECDTISYRGRSEESSEIQHVFNGIYQGYQNIIDLLKRNS